MRVVLMTVLIFEGIVFGLAIPVMILVSGVAPAAAAGFGGGAALVAPAARAVVAGGAALMALAAAGLLRSRLGYILGWIAQLVGLALGFLTPMMFVVGAVLGGGWLLACSLL